LLTLVTTKAYINNFTIVGIHCGYTRWVYTVGCTRHVALRSEWQPHTEAVYRPQHPHSEQDRTIYRSIIRPQFSPVRSYKAYQH
ncbi:hypothetical protein EJ02DRAFT_477691, partial [Clathrospora elynae]